MILTIVDGHHPRAALRALSHHSAPRPGGLPGRLTLIQSPSTLVRPMSGVPAGVTGRNPVQTVARSRRNTLFQCREGTARATEDGLPPSLRNSSSLVSISNPRPNGGCRAAPVGDGHKWGEPARCGADLSERARSSVSVLTSFVSNAKQSQGPRRKSGVGSYGRASLFRGMVAPAGRDRPHGDQHQAQKRSARRLSGSRGGRATRIPGTHRIPSGSDSERGRNRSGRRTANSDRLLRGIAPGRRLRTVVRSALLVLFERSQLGGVPNGGRWDLLMSSIALELWIAIGWSMNWRTPAIFATKVATTRKLAQMTFGDKWFVRWQDLKKPCLSVGPARTGAWEGDQMKDRLDDILRSRLLPNNPPPGYGGGRLSRAQAMLRAGRRAVQKSHAAEISELSINGAAPDRQPQVC